MNRLDSRAPLVLCALAALGVIGDHADAATAVDDCDRLAAAAGRQSARVQYVRYALRGSFAGCPGAATGQQMRAMLDAAAKDATGIYQQALVEDLGAALAARDPNAPRAASCRCDTKSENPPLTMTSPR